MCVAAQRVCHQRTPLRPMGAGSFGYPGWWRFPSAVVALGAPHLTTAKACPEVEGFSALVAFGPILAACVAELALSRTGRYR